MIKEFVKDRIAEIRTRANISARALSIELGMSENYIINLENGQFLPPLTFIEDFCVYFKMDIEDFFIKDFPYPEKYKEFMKKITTLNTEKFDYIDNLVDLLQEKK